MTLPACMGGWCRRRDECADYHATYRALVAERLCPPGEDKPERPVRIVRQSALLESQWAR